MEKQTKNVEDITIEKHGDWVKDDIDKIINKVLITSKKELTFTQLKNEVYSAVFETMSKEKLMDRLLRLKEMGILDNVPKETKIEVWKAK